MYLQRMTIMCIILKLSNIKYDLRFGRKINLYIERTIVENHIGYTTSPILTLKTIDPSIKFAITRSRISPSSSPVILISRLSWKISRSSF